MVDYSKWDGIGADSDEEKEAPPRPPSSSGSGSSGSGSSAGNAQPKTQTQKAAQDILKTLSELNFKEDLRSFVEQNSAPGGIVEQRHALNLYNANTSSGHALKEFAMRCCAKCGVREDGLITENGKMENEKKLRYCGECKNHKVLHAPGYCSRECQTADWSSHKRQCGKKAEHLPEMDGSWSDKWRAAQDESRHFGKLELITWSFVNNDRTLGWGGVFEEESAELKRKFEGEPFNGSEHKFVKKNSCCFRWTCCGMSVGEGTHGCDHHGDPRAFQPCKCDFCLAGRRIDADLKPPSTYSKGLKLSRGPDPKSVCEAGLKNWELREKFMQSRTGF